MNLLDWVRNLFVKSKPKPLPAPTTNIEKPKNQSIKKSEREHFLTDLSNHCELPKNNTIEHAIDQYLMSLYCIYQQDHIVNSYRALYNLEAYDNGNSEQNRKIEEDLIKNLNQNPNYIVFEQKNKNGNTAFYHIKSKNYDEKNQDSKTENRVRLYINLMRKNIAAFSSELISELKDEDFYFKFISDEHLDTKKRSESIVIYTTLDKINTIIPIINNIKAKHPQLVKDTYGVNPFMKKVNEFTACAPDVDGTYINEKHQKIEISKSFNTLLSTALEDSYVSVAREIIASDRDLTISTDGNIFQESAPYVKLYPMIRQKYQNQLIDKMKQKLEKAMKRNHSLDLSFESDKDTVRT